jgi:hypothetical protein
MARYSLCHGKAAELPAAAVRQQYNDYKPIHDRQLI